MLHTHPQPLYWLCSALLLSIFSSEFPWSMLQSNHLSQLGMISNFMARTILFVLLSILLIPSHTHVLSIEEGFISVDISDKGLDFVKDLLINKAVSSLTQLPLPQIEKSVKIPVIGRVHIVLSNITVCGVDVSSSSVNPGDGGITIVASGATANLSMDWRYSYHTWLLPITISDEGVASILVEGIEVGLVLGLKNHGGSLKLSLLKCECSVKDISIKLDGGASWLYQGVMDVFEGKIGSAVENSFSEKIRDEIVNLDSLLQSLPKEIPLDDVAYFNITFVNDPVLGNSSIDLEIDGLFTAKDEIAVSKHYNENLQAPISCKGPANMVEISVHENVLNSASLVFYQAGVMHWIIDKIPDQSLLNTASWRYVIPELYKKYPNDDLNLNITVSSPPIIKVTKHNIDATVYLDVTVDVFDAGEEIPVACISMVIRLSGFAQISRNNDLGGRVKLIDFAMDLKWSKIGNLRMHVVQSIMSTILKTIVLPCANLRLRSGFHLPVLHGYMLQNAQIFCTDSRITICSNVASMKQYKLDELLLY